MKVLVSAYACEPGRGSEPGAGWEWACAAAAQHDVWVLTHETNREPVLAALTNRPELQERLHPVFLRNSRWARPLRRHGPTRFLYYVIWQLTVCRRVAAQLHSDVAFDVAHHLTYASDWLPAGVAVLPDVPFIWGPVGGSSTTGGPRLWRLLGYRPFVSELVRLLLLTPARFVFGQHAARRATLVLGQNRDVKTRFERYAAVVVSPNIALGHEAVVAREVARARPQIALFAGRLVAWKGLRLALAALRRPEAETWHLHIYGDGPERATLERLARRWGIAERVRFFGSRPRAEVLQALAHAGVLLFPSIHDAGGWAVAEAIEAGCPVVALDVGGPAVLVTDEDGVLVRVKGDVVGALAGALAEARACNPQTGRWTAARLPDLVGRMYDCACAVAPVAHADAGS